MKIQPLSALVGAGFGVASLSLGAHAKGVQEGQPIEVRPSEAVLVLRGHEHSARRVHEGLVETHLVGTRTLLITSTSLLFVDNVGGEEVWKVGRPPGTGWAHAVVG